MTSGEHQTKYFQVIIAYDNIEDYDETQTIKEELRNWINKNTDSRKFEIAVKVSHLKQMKQVALDNKTIVILFLRHDIAIGLEKHSRKFKTQKETIELIKAESLYVLLAVHIETLLREIVVTDFWENGSVFSKGLNKGRTETTLIAEKILEQFNIGKVDKESETTVSPNNASISDAAYLAVASLIISIIGIVTLTWAYISYETDCTVTISSGFSCFKIDTLWWVGVIAILIGVLVLASSFLMLITHNNNADPIVFMD